MGEFKTTLTTEQQFTLITLLIELYESTRDDIYLIKIDRILTNFGLG